MQDPCGRLPAPDSYAGSAAPSIAGFGGHPTRFSRLRASRATGTTPMFVKAFYERDSRRVCFLLKGGHDREGPLLAEGRLLSGHEVQQLEMGARSGRRIDRRPAPVAAAD